MVKAKEGIFFALNRADFVIESRQFALNFKEHQKNNCGSDVVQFEFEIDRKDGFETSFSIQSDDILVVGYTLLASLTALALIEHWFMVVPIRDAELWKWMLPTSVSKKEKLKKNKKQVSSEKIHGL